jgi:multidrug efflux pump subunit AcrA (membrane-fusion protein)
MEVRTRIDEHQRANVNAGQTAQVIFDALPGVQSTAKVMSVANLATRSMEGPSPVRQFDAILRLDNIDPRLRPGTTTRMLLKGATVQAVHVPRTAVFEKDGKPVVYVRPPDSERFEAVPVKITHRTETRTAVEGIAAGTEVSLVNPEKSAKKPNAVAPPAPPAPGGPR